jgi:hypothetical protein
MPGNFMRQTPSEYHLQAAGRLHVESSSLAADVGRVLLDRDADPIEGDGCNGIVASTRNSLTPDEALGGTI